MLRAFPLSRLAVVLIAGAFAHGVHSLGFDLGHEIVIPVGGARGPLMVSSLGPSEAGADLTKEETRDDRRSFYFRQILGRHVTVSIPVVAEGSFGVALRMDSTIRTKVGVEQQRNPIGEGFVSSGPWARTALVESGLRGSADFQLRLEDAPLVGRADTQNFRRYIDEVILTTNGLFEIAWPSRLAAGVVCAGVAWLALVTAGPILGSLVVLVDAVLVFLIARTEPIAAALAFPRLLGFMIGVAILIALLSRALRVDQRRAAGLALIGSCMVFAYGFLSFLPNHSPADLDIHIWRTIDLESVAPTYDAWLLYGSHYPTPSQARGAATDALGSGPPIPYSPLPYLFFHAARILGLDPHWSMNAIEASSLALLLPLVFAFTRALSDEIGGLIAALLLAVDLPMIHHLGRAHSPAVVGGALGIASLLLFGLALPRIDEFRMTLNAAVFLGIGALGYSSTPLFYALFGLALLTALVAVAGTRPAFAPSVGALVIGGLAALILFYGHYIPGLVAGQSSAISSDPFPGRTFFIFHNESRQSLRLWRLGLYLPMVATLIALVPALSKSDLRLRAFVMAWIAAFAGIMILKEPFGFPRLLRWAKEDFYVAPMMAIVIASAIARIESKRLRTAAALLAIAAALFLRWQDYGYHADTLRFLR